MKRFRKKFPKQPTSKFKSKLEEDFNNFLIKQKIKFGYEDYKVSYLKPEKLSKYTPDFNCPAIDTFKIIFETNQWSNADVQNEIITKFKNRNYKLIKKEHDAVLEKIKNVPSIFY